MIDFMHRPKSARTGSNVTHEAAFREQVAHDTQPRITARLRALRALRSRRNKLIGKRASKQAAAIIGRSRTAFDQAFLDATRDGRDSAGVNDTARRSMHRALLKHVAGYREYRAAQKSSLEGLRGPGQNAGAGPLHNELDVTLGNRTVSSDVDFQDFSAPYELFSCETWADPIAEFNASFADPDSGLVVQNIKWLHEHDSWVLPALYNPPLLGHAVSVVGINYLVPATGRLRCSAVLHNLHNRITSSVTDYFGLSHTDVTAPHRILIRVVRSGEWTRFARVLATGGMQSFGREWSYILESIQNTTPYTLSFTTNDVFLKGERIQILAGSEIMVDSFVDDMLMRIESLWMWRVGSLRVSMHD